MNPKNSLRQNRLLGFDIGSKRIGLALWNPGAQLASPLPIRHRKTLKEDLAFFLKVLSDHQVEGLVVGIPTSLQGRETESTKNARFWVDKLTETMNLPVYTADEAMSTKEANEILRETSSVKRRDEKRDSIAAALILEEFIRGLAE